MRLGIVLMGLGIGNVRRASTRRLHGRFSISLYGRWPDFRPLFSSNSTVYLTPVVIPKYMHVNVEYPIAPPLFSRVDGHEPPIHHQDLAIHIPSPFSHQVQRSRHDVHIPAMRCHLPRFSHEEGGARTDQPVWRGVGAASV